MGSHHVRAGAPYASRIFAFGYAVASPLYDLIAWWGFLPLGGERRCRRQFARWMSLSPGSKIASLCCGTGGTERAILAEMPDVSITGVDLGRGQLARARRRTSGAGVAYVLGDAAETGLPGGSYDRVLIGLALHEMTRPTRLAVLREARRLCSSRGRVLVIEHGRPAKPTTRLLRALWWFFWVPGNPEVSTSRDLQRRGLEVEMRECGLEPIEHHTTRPDWIEAFLAAPSHPAPEAPP